MPKEIYKQKFREAWTQSGPYKDWVQRDPRNPLRAFCAFCKCSLIAKLSDLRSHAATKKHQCATGTYSQEAAAAANREVDWNPKDGKKLVALYRMHRNLYDPSDESYNKKEVRLQSYEQILEELDNPEYTIEHIKNKIINMRNLYRNYLRTGKFKYKAKGGFPTCQSPPLWLKSMEFLKPFMRFKEEKNSGYLSPNEANHSPCFTVDEAISEAISGLLETTEQLDDAYVTEINEKGEVDDGDLRGENGDTDSAHALIEYAVEAADPLNAECNSPEANNKRRRLYSDDVETFGEYMKAEMQLFQGVHSRRILRQKLMMVLLEHQ